MDMKYLRRFCLITLITFSYLISLPTHSFPKDSKLPQEIKNFYQDLNFVNLYSSRNERNYLAYSLGLQPGFLILPNERNKKRSPKEIKLYKKRLKEVLNRLLVINSKIWHIDPGIYTSAWLSGPDSISYYDYYEIEKVEVEYDQDIIKIYTDSYNISPVHNEYFVANYGTEKNASEKYYSKEFFKLIEKKKAYNKPRTEIHFWVKFDDVWMIGDKSIMLLSLNKLSL